jgi:hypothetical protein
MQQLAAADPVAYEPALALSLNDLSNNLTDVGRKQEAKRVSREAFELGRGS